MSKTNRASPYPKQPPRPDAKPSEAGLARGEPMRGASAKPSPAAPTSQPPTAQTSPRGRALPVLAAVPRDGTTGSATKKGAEPAAQVPLLKCPPRPQYRSLSGLALPQNRALRTGGT